MKLKFKAKPQDWLIFALFLVVLLYATCIFVLNVHSVATGEGFFGLNPFPAFFPSMIGYTVMFFLIFLVGIFLAVKSYFFEKEKGFGISFGEKEDKGYNRFFTDKEMKEKLKKINIKDDTYDSAGIPIINNGKEIWLDDENSHSIVIGTTGSGKTQDLVHPMVKVLARKGESMIITDPKAEIYQQSAGLLKKKGYKIVVLNFRDPQRGNCWNPLDLPYKLYKQGDTDKAMELLDDVASNILYEEGGQKDAFWEKSSADYFSALALGLFEDAKEDEVNLNSISVMSTVGEERFAGRSTYIKEYFNDKDPASAAYTCASGTVMAAEETKASILSTFKQKIRLFASRENLSEMLSHSDFDMFDIGRHKTAVFMIIQDEKKTYHALATIFVKQCYETLIGVAQDSPKGELPVRTNFILDEFQNMPPLKDVTTMIAAARSRCIRLTMIIQNFAGLEATYSKEVAQTLRSNCTNLIYLLTTELSALEEISKLCGEKKVKVGKGDKEHEESRPLITVSELQLMKPDEAIVIRTRCRPYKTKLYKDYKTDWGIPNYKAEEFVHREKMPIHVFDLKSFVKEKRQNKFMEMMDQPNPFMNIGGGMSDGPSLNSNPFDMNQEKFNVDDLVKKIDQKIAELEAEEKAEEEKKKKEQKKKPEFVDIKPIDQDSLADSKIVIDEIKELTDENINEQEPEKDVPTDDQFFDDFFDE